MAFAALDKQEQHLANDPTTHNPQQDQEINMGNDEEPAGQP